MSQTFKKTIIAGVFGNILESYDFSVYAFFSPILSQIFFPNNSTFIALLLTFGIFALSFLVRPFGGIVFGFLGDSVGRKKTLIISIALMSIPTLLLGLLPGYVSIGIGAPLLLTALRLLQGISISGELATSMSYLVEHAPPQKRGLIGSLTLCTSCAGGVIGSAFIALLSLLLSHQQLMDWGWRLPFIFGGCLGLIGLYLRVRVPLQETALFEKAKKEKTLSFIQHYRQLNYKSVMNAMLLTGIMAMGFYFYMGYFNTFLIKTLGHATQPIMAINFISQVALALLMPLFGWLSDKRGRKPVFKMGVIGLLVGSYPVFYCLQQTLPWVLIGELLFIILIAPLIALLPTMLAEMFQTKTRNTGIALGYNLGQALFGGTAPLIALSLTQSTHNFYAPAWYLMAASFLSLLTLFFIKESYQQTLT